MEKRTASSRSAACSALKQASHDRSTNAGLVHNCDQRGTRHARAWGGRGDAEFATFEWMAWFDTQQLLEPLGYRLPADSGAEATRKDEVTRAALYDAAACTWAVARGPRIKGARLPTLSTRPGSASMLERGTVTKSMENQYTSSPGSVIDWGGSGNPDAAEYHYVQKVWMESRTTGEAEIELDDDLWIGPSSTPWAVARFVWLYDNSFWQVTSEPDTLDFIGGYSTAVAHADGYFDFIFPLCYGAQGEVIAAAGTTGGLDNEIQGQPGFNSPYYSYAGVVSAPCNSGYILARTIM